MDISGLDERMTRGPAEASLTRAQRKEMTVDEKPTQSTDRYLRVRDGKSRPGQLFSHATDKKRWLAKIFSHRDGKGRQKYLSKVVRGSKSDADLVLLEMHHQKRTGGLRPRSKATLRGLTAEWLEHKKRDVSPRTLSGYAYVLDRYVLPSLGHRKLADLEVRDIDKLYGMMLGGELPSSDGAGGASGNPLSPRTIRLTHAALRQALSQAVTWGMLPNTPAAGVTLPKQRVSEKDWMTTAERARFIAASQQSFYGTLYRLMLDVGLRPGEAFGLRWTDIDFVRGTVSVNRAVTRDGSNGALLAEPKTAKSRRTVPLVAGLPNELLAHKERQREIGFAGEGFVFTNQSGRMLRPWTFNARDLARLVHAAGIGKSLSLYSLRHTFATVALSTGVPIKIVSEWLGHTTIQQTADTYGHVDSGISGDWMERLGRGLEATMDVAPAMAN